jgi:hypothetical protein
VSKLANLLVAAGSIYWSKTQTRSPTKIAESHKGQQPKTEKRDLAKYPDRLNLSLPDTTGSRGDAGAEAKKEIEYLSQRYAKDSQDFAKSYLESPDKLRLVKNTACFIFRNEIIYIYDKKYPAEEELGYPGECFLPGTRPPAFDLPVSQAAKFRIGIELCADHVHGSLMLHTQRNIDIHVLLSCWIDTYPQYRWVKDGGLFVHCDAKNRPEVEQLYQGQAAKGESEDAPKLLDATPASWGTKVFHYLTQLP